MTIRDLKNVWVNRTPVCITALAYFKNSKKYYSFRTLDWDRSITTFSEITDKAVLDMRIKSICLTNGKLYIDVIEWIDDFKEEDL